MWLRVGCCGVAVRSKFGPYFKGGQYGRRAPMRSDRGGRGGFGNDRRFGKA